MNTKHAVRATMKAITAVVIAILNVSISIRPLLRYCRDCPSACAAPLQAAAASDAIAMFAASPCRYGVASVNVAARLESMNKAFGTRICISDNMFDAVAKGHRCLSHAAG